MAAVPSAPPIRGVVLDFHHTLVHGGDAAQWLATTWTTLDRDETPELALGAVHAQAVDFLDHFWDHARLVDPDNTRDMDQQRHRQVWDATIASAPGVDDELADALYRAMPQQWDAYEDTKPVLEALRRAGIRIAMLSNCGYDLTPILDRTGIAPVLDAVVMSCVLGVVKPDERIFRQALTVIGLAAEEALMVGDDWRDDAAAAALGIRTLVLPRTDGPVHGLELVLRIAGVTPG